MKNGSITPFCAVVLMFVTSLLLALLELARIFGLDSYTTMKADAAMDSVCAEYQPYLWLQYGLLFLDGAYGAEHFSKKYVTESLENYMNMNCYTDGHFFQIEDFQVQLEGYALATDDNGDLFLSYVAERAKENLPLGMAEDLYEQYTNAKELEERHSRVEESIVQANQALEEIKSEWSLKQDEEEYVDLDTSMLEKVLGSSGDVRDNGTLKMIFGDLSGISEKSSRISSELLRREKEEGNLQFTEQNNWYQRILVLDYMEDYFSNYLNKKEGHYLEYEMEYVICGKPTEQENLRGALERVMLIREAANVAYLLQDEEKMAIVEGLASLVGMMAVENPGVVKVIKLGIVGAWAYMESVLDVRELIAGGSIPLIKQGSEWTTEIANLLVLLDEDARAKTCEEGLSYVDYLKQILFLQGSQRLAYRMMEVMEIGMQQMEEYRNCKMNQMLIALRYKIQMQGEPIFSSLIAIGEVYDGKYYFSKEVERSYIP